MKPLSPELYKNRKDADAETVYELTTAEIEPEWGIAVADIGVSQLHVHRHMREVYVVVQGSLDVQVGTGTVSLVPGGVVEIPPGTPHMARSTSQARARVVVTTIPAWTPEDHILCAKQ